MAETHEDVRDMNPYQEAGIKMSKISIAVSPPTYNKFRPAQLTASKRTEGGLYRQVSITSVVNTNRKGIASAQAQVAKTMSAESARATIRTRQGLRMSSTWTELEVD